MLQLDIFDGRRCREFPRDTPCGQLKWKMSQKVSIVHFEILLFSLNWNLKKNHCCRREDKKCSCWALWTLHLIFYHSWHFLLGLFPWDCQDLLASGKSRLPWTDSSPKVHYWSLQVVVSGMSGAIFIIDNSFKAWNKNPVITAVAQIPIEQVPFPSITICKFSWILSKIKLQ